MDFLQLGFSHLLHDLGRDLLIGMGKDFASGGVEQVLGEALFEQVVVLDFYLADVGGGDFAHLAAGDAASGLGQRLAGFVHYVDAQFLPYEAFRHHCQNERRRILAFAFALARSFPESVVVGFVKQVQNFAVVVAESAQKYGRRHFALAVYAHVQVVFDVELKVQPGTAVRHDA